MSEETGIVSVLNWWINLNHKLPSFCTPIAINEHEFITTTAKKGVWKYNTINDTWMVWIKYAETLIALNYDNEPITCYDKDNKLIYGYEPDEGALMCINTETHKIDIKQNLIGTGCGAKAIFMDNTVHIIGGVDNTKHLTYNKISNKFVETYNFDEYNEPFGGCSLLDISSQKQLLLIGGYGNKISNGNMCALDSIYSYSYDLYHQLSERKWIKSEMKIPANICFFGCAMTKNQQYMIICGGSIDAGTMTDNIYVIDLKINKTMICNVHCPMASSYDAIIMSDGVREEIIVFGFIRKCWEKESLSVNVFPHDSIIKLIQSWFCEDWLHLLQIKDAQTIHWKISVDTILNECKDE